MEKHDLACFQVDSESEPIKPETVSFPRDKHVFIEYSLTSLSFSNTHS